MVIKTPDAMGAGGFECVGEDQAADKREVAVAVTSLAVKHKPLVINLC